MNFKFLINIGEMIPIKEYSSTEKWLLAWCVSLIITMVVTVTVLIVRPAIKITLISIILLLLLSTCMVRVIIS